VRRLIEPELASNGRVLALFQPDLDAAQHFSEGLLVLTDSRLLWATNGSDVRSLRLDEVATLVGTDRGGLGVLEARSEKALLARFYYTVGRAKQAATFVETFERVRAGGRFGAAVEIEPEVPEAIQPESAPKVGTLFRLLRFARPHIAYLTLAWC